MSLLNSKQPVKVQRKSGYSKSFQNLFTSRVGSITPIFVDELIPNSTVNLSTVLSAQLPPLASDTFMRCYLKYAAFFVPSRILMPQYEKWLVGDSSLNSAGTSFIHPPLLYDEIFAEKTDAQKSAFYHHWCAGSLSDFLGFKLSTNTFNSWKNTSSATSEPSFYVSALPFLAYHKIYNDYFRNPLVQKDIFSANSFAETTYNAANSNGVVPYQTSGGVVNFLINAGSSGTPTTSPYFADGHHICDLRQANFGLDLYTNATPNAQNGEAQKVSFDTSGSEGEFTISALRAANSIQQFLERNNIAGPRLVDYVKAHYGANLSDSIAQRPILLGSGQFDVYSKGIYQTTQGFSEEVMPHTGNNPFNSVGARYGSAFSEGSENLIEHFTASEPGYLMVLCWLSPKVTYSTGINPILDRYLESNSQSDMANPILQNIGNQPIYSRYMHDDHINQNSGYHDHVFGYSDCYFQWKDKTDELHGLLRDGESLESFALQRTFDSSSMNISISSNFLQIPVDYLDQVAAVSSNISEYGYWCDSFFKYHVSMPLAKYSIPSLQDPAYEHGETVLVAKGGTKIQ